MNIILRISLRNLLRQKRRNLLLGTAIAVGTMLLVLANAFSHGISDTLFNRIVVFVAGQVNVSFTQGGDMFRQIFHDRERMLALVRGRLPDAVRIEESVGFMARAIGNGRSDNVVLVGLDFSQRFTAEQMADYENNFKMVEGRLEDLTSDSMENPVFLATAKAQYLGLKRGDLMRIRFRDVNGQDQAARLTVAGVFKAANIFMQAPVFLNLADLRVLSGFGPHDLGCLFITIRDPKRNAVRTADSLHAVLTPGLAAMAGSLAGPTGRAPAVGLCMKSDSLSRLLLSDSLRLTAGSAATAFSRQGVVVADSLAAALRLGPGDTCRLTWRPRYGNDSVDARFKVSGVFAARPGLSGASVLISERDFYPAFYRNWPVAVASTLLPPAGAPLAAALGSEWMLLRRARSSDDMAKQYRDIARMRSAATTVDVQSMYESASYVVQLEGALNLITLVAVAILFFIILVGVVNTLRMAIRERTREIGTMRAIGMQRSDVRNSFVYETFFLALFASLAGTALAFVAMWLLGLWVIDPGENPMGMLLVNGHLQFAPTLWATLVYLAVIPLIAAATAWWPARRAARMQASAALRHYE